MSTACPILIIETTADYMEHTATLPPVATLDAAIAAAREAGYRVMTDADGGCCCTSNGYDKLEARYGTDWAHHITVYPES